MIQPRQQDERARDLLLAALERSLGERERFLAQACHADPQLRAAVEALLAAHARAESLFEPEAPALGEQPGQRIDRYRLRQRLGEGGFGVVWSADQEEPVRRAVALKVLKPGMDTAQVVARFEAERQALARMDHPNIARVFDGGATPSGRPFFVMELVEGRPITEFCDDAGLGMRQRLSLFAQVCQAVQHAHQKGVIHRDLKPGNVLVAQHDGVAVPKVIDFGIAKATSGALTEKTVFTEFRQMLGTPDYMAPEQAELSSLDVDTRADIYSLGVLLYELLTGTRPFELKTLLLKGYAEMLRTIKEVDPPRPSTRVSTLGERLMPVAKQRRVHPRALGSLIRGDLDWIVMKALDKNRARRYATAAALAEDVQRHLDREPVLAGPPGGLYRLRKYVDRHRVGVLAGSAIAAALVTGLGVSLYGLREARIEATAARLAEGSERAQRAAAELAREGEARERQRAEEREQEANAQAERARQVAGLLQRMLASSEPHAAKGASYPVRFLLDDFEREVGDRLSAVPEVEAELRVTLGNSFLGLGLTARARPHLERALEIRRGGTDAKATAAALFAWTLYLHDDGDYREASAAAEQALAVFEQAGDGDRSGDVLRWLSDLAGHLDRPSEAVAHARRALELERACHGEEHGDVAAAHHHLARALLRVDEPGAAKAGAEQALAIDRTLLGDAHPFVASRLLLLAEIRGELGEHEAEADAARQAVAIREARLGPEHPETLAAKKELASALLDLGRAQESVDLYREILAQTRTVHGAGSRAEITALHGLGSALLRLGSHAEAIRQLRRALALAQKVHGGEHAEVATCLGTLGQALRDDGRSGEALPLLQEAADLARRVHGPRHSLVALWLSDLCLALTDVGRLEAAEAAAVEACSILAASSGEDSARAVQASLNHAHVLQAQGRCAEAETVLRAAMPRAARRFGDPSRELASAWNSLGCAQRDLKRFEEAAASFEKAISMTRVVIPGTSPALVACLNNLGTVQAARGEHAAAAVTFREVLQLYESISSPGHPRCALALVNLAHVHLALGEPDAAADYARRAMAILPDGAPSRIDAQAKLGSALAKKGARDEAIPYLRQALDLQRQLRPAGDYQTVTLLVDLGRVLQESQRPAEAELLFAESLALLDRLVPQSAERSLILAQLGRVLAEQGKLAEAEPKLLEAVTGWPGAPATDPRYRTAVADLVRAYEGLGQAEKAADWRQKLAVPGADK